MSDRNAVDNVLKKPTSIIVIFYCIQEMVFYTIFYPGNYTVWAYRAVAGVIMVSLVLLFTGIKGLTNRQLSIFVPCSIAIVEIITCLMVHVDKQLFIFLMGIALLSLTYIDIVGLLVTIMFTCTTYAIITMGFRIPQTGVEFHFEYDLSSVISLITIDFLIFLLGKFSIGALDRSRRTGQTFDSILETTPNLIVIVNDEARVEYISKSLAELLRIEKQENAVGVRFTDIFSTKEEKFLFGGFLQRKGPIEETFDLQYDGKRHWFILRSVTIGESKIARLFECVEITRIVELQLAAEAATRSKSEFLAMMSHEIRTPMNAIIGITQIELQKADLPEKYMDAFDRIYNSGSSLLGIINDILDLTKIETGNLEINPVEYNTANLINDAIQLNIVRIDSKQIQFMLDIDENLPSRLYGDELRIKQVLNNLLSNAIKYTEKGYVKLSVTYTADGDGGLSDSPMMLCFTVEDTGQGLKPENKKRLFLEYSRFNNEANRSTEGTGLGLYITKRLVDMMGGSVLVESEYGKGSVFTVMIRQKVVESAAIGPELAESLRNFSFHSRSISKKAQIVHEYMPYGSVLVVDDVASNLYVAKGLLTPYGLRIETVSSGTEAIEKIKAAMSGSGGAYDIVFMDHMMPLMDGMEAVKIIRDMGYTRPIIALTANAIVGQSDIFMANGFDDFISKPIDSRELDAILDRFIRDKQPREIIEATRREQRRRGKAISETEKYFVLDAENAIKALKDVYAKLDTSGAEVTERYITAVHGMKSALTNIGETELSDAALKLEQAGNTRDFAVIMAETPAFMDVLRFLINKYQPSGGDETTEISGDDEVYLKDRLLEIKTACGKFDITAAKGALDELRQKTWPHQTNKTLDEIFVHLLHSAFKKAADIAENALEM